MMIFFIAAISILVVIFNLEFLKLFARAFAPVDPDKEM